MGPRGNSLRGTAFRLLTIRDRSSAEMRTTLTERGFADQNIESLLEELRDLGLVDDERLAERLAQQRLEKGRVGPLRVERELMRRGIARSTAQRVVEEIAQDMDVREAALDLARRKAQRLDGTGQPGQMGRMGRFLLSRGFSGDTVNWVLDQLYPDRR